MDKSLLVRLIGFPATLIHGDTTVLDRWLWLKPRLPQTRNGEKLLDVGCGTGAFSMGAALRGYHSLGLSWDDRNQQVASERAAICKAELANFEVLDVRKLDTKDDLFCQFDVAICCENIEHIIDDLKLMKDIYACLKPGGRLLLTTPYLLYQPITSGDMGPFSKTEDGGHVRRGYTKAMLEEICKEVGFVIEEVSYCTGILSQKAVTLQRFLANIHPAFAWATILPIRPLLPVLDGFVTDLVKWPYLSICVQAYKPRFSGNKSGVAGSMSVRSIVRSPNP